MRRFFHQGLPEHGVFALEGDEGTHLARVLRARPGDEVLVFDGRGREAVCRVADVRKDAATIEVVAPHEPRRPGRDVMLCTAAPRGDRMEWLVEKCVEAGATSIVPWAAARSVRERAGESTLRRWRRSALEACKQCGRADLPDVSDVVQLSEALARAAGRVLLVASPGAPRSLDAALDAPRDAARDVARGGAAPVAVFVGPEGGFTPEEDALLAAAGARPFGLGALVLRIETAATIAVHLAVASAR